MKNAWTIGLAAAAMAALSLTAMGGTAHRQVADAGASETPYYVRGPRIIHVPQPGVELTERDDIEASVGRDPATVLPNDSAGYDIAPMPRKRVPARAHRNVRKEPEHKSSATQRYVRTAPRRKLRNDAAPPPTPLGPRRAVLSAPPPRAGGPSPIYPTPRFEANAEAAEKFERPRQTEAAADPPAAEAAPQLTNELPAATEN